MVERYCNNCQQYTNFSKTWSWGAFFLITIFTLGFGSVLYIFYWLLKRRSCAICGGRNYGNPPQYKHKQGHSPNHSPHQQGANPQHQHTNQPQQGNQVNQGQQFGRQNQRRRPQDNTEYVNGPNQQEQPIDSDVQEEDSNA
jgi:hypothetical protein